MRWLPGLGSVDLNLFPQYSYDHDPYPSHHGYRLFENHFLVKFLILCRYIVNQLGFPRSGRFLNPEALTDFQELQWRTMTYSGHSRLHLSQVFFKEWKCFFWRRSFSPPLVFSCDVVICFLSFALTVQGVFEARCLFAPNFIFSEFFHTGIWSDVPSTGEVCHSTSLFQIGRVCVG